MNQNGNQNGGKRHRTTRKRFVDRLGHQACTHNSQRMGRQNRNTPCINHALYAFRDTIIVSYSQIQNHFQHSEFHRAQRLSSPQHRPIPYNFYSPLSYTSFHRYICINTSTINNIARAQKHKKFDETTRGLHHSQTLSKCDQNHAQFTQHSCLSMGKLQQKIQVKMITFR